MIQATTSTTRRSRARARRAARPARTAAPVIRAWTRLATIWIIRLMRGMLLSLFRSLSLSLLLVIPFLSRVLWFVCLFDIPVSWFGAAYPLFCFCLDSFLSIHLSSCLPASSYPVSTPSSPTRRNLSRAAAGFESARAREKESSRENMWWEKKDSSYPFHGICLFVFLALINEWFKSY